MFAVYRPVAALLLAVSLAVAGNGLIGTMLPLAAEKAGWTEILIGFLGSAYFAGMLIGAFLSPAIIAHVGHDRAFTAVVALATVATLGASVLRDPIAWIVARGLIGFSFAILYSTVESWLQGTSENAVRGRVLAVYSLVQYVGWAGGNMLVTVEPPGSDRLFELGAILVAAAIIPVAVSRARPPERPSRPTLPVALLWRKAPIGLVGVFLIGFANGPFWTLAPIFGTGIGMSTAAVGFFITMLTLGAAILQVPVGRLSDMGDRRLVLIGLLAVTTSLELLLGRFGASLPTLAVDVVGFGLGGFIATQYYVLIAHVNDRTGRENVVGISALMLFLYCCGAIIGPVTAADAMTRFGPGALLYHNALVHIVFIGYVVWRVRRREAPQERTTEPVALRSSSS